MTIKLQNVETGPTFGVRHVQVILLFALVTIGMGMRSVLSVAILAMTDNTTSSNPDIPTYDWDNKSVILSSFYWGYIWLQLAAGDIGRTYGTKKFLTGAMFINSVAFILIPFMAEKLGSYGVMGCRVVQVLSQGFLYPSVYNMLSKWTPQAERSRMTNIASSGAPVADLIFLPITGYISSSWIGWPWAFYLYGILCLIWILFWCFFAADSPSDHRSITDDERNYIENTLTDKENIQLKQMKVPWKAIFTSLPVWALIVVQTFQSWGNITLLTEMPDYMSKVMKFDIKSNGILFAGPSTVCFILGFFFASLSDYVINNGYWQRGLSRKVFTSISNLTSAATLVTLSFIPVDATILTVTMFVLSLGLHAALAGGYGLNHLDLAPKFSGILMAITNSLTTVTSILAPLLVQFIVTDETDKSQWSIIFIVSSVLYLAGNTFYLLFGSSEVQWWNDSEQAPDPIDEK